MDRERHGQASWMEAIEEIAPTVLVLGGFLTAPPLYFPLRARLLERGAAAVVIANVWTPDWLLAGARGLGPIVTRSGRALLEAGRVSAASARSRGAPVLVVGHSAGGMSGRLLMSPEPFAGRRLNAWRRIGALATLGTPHRVADDGVIGHEVARIAAAHAARTMPGPFFAPRVGYLAVASRAVVGRPDGGLVERAAYATYQALLPQPGAEAIEGDGVVPVESALLDGAPSIILDDVVHGQGAPPMRPWYGSGEGLDRWWPAALETWRAALRVRVAE